MLEKYVKITDNIVEYFHELYELIDDIDFPSEYEYLRIRNIIAQINIDILKIMVHQEYNLDEINECLDK